MGKKFLQHTSTEYSIRHIHFSQYHFRPITEASLYDGRTRYGIYGFKNNTAIKDESQLSPASVKPTTLPYILNIKFGNGFHEAKGELKFMCQNKGMKYRGFILQPLVIAFTPEEGFMERIHNH